MDERFWINVVSGADRRWPAAILRSLLAMAEPGYFLATTVRNQLYNHRLKSINRLPVPVLSIGNLTTGGTGKTPTTAWLVEHCLRAGCRPGILSRGYRSLDGAANDEKRLLDQLFPGIPHLQNRDRIAGGRQLLSQSECDLLILDDGFQHRRLHRDFDLLLIDSLNPWGYGHLLPRGALRESLRGLARANAILLTRTDQADPQTIEILRARIAERTAAPVFRTRFLCTGLIDVHGRKLEIQTIQGARIGALCGIGNPASFQKLLADLGLPVADDALRLFPDHYHYTADDIVELGRWATRNRFDRLLTTRKDLVKLPCENIGTATLHAVDIRLEFIDADGVERITAALSPVLSQTTPSSVRD